MRSIILDCLLVAAAAALAACTNAAAPDSKVANLPGSSNDPIEFSAPVTVTTLTSGQTGIIPVPGEEPFLHGGADGSMYLVLPHVPAMFRSDDHGLAWNPVYDARSGAGSEIFGGGDAAMASTGDGSVYWIGLFGPGGHMPFQRTGDHGQHWSAPLDLSPDDVSPDRQWLMADAGGTLVTVWAATVHGDPACDNTGHNCARVSVSRTSRDHGATWSDRVTVSNTGYAGAPAAGATPSEFFVPHSDVTADGVVVARSRDAGATWVLLPAITGLHGPDRLGEFGPEVVNFPYLAVDAADNLYVTYTTDDPLVSPYLGSPVAPQAVFLVRSFDGGEHWTAPLRISSPGTNGIYGWVVAGAAGRIAIAWYEDETGGSRLIPSRWHTRLAVATDADRPELTLRRGEADPLAHLGIICNECGGLSRLDHLGIAMAPGGEVVVAWIRDNAQVPANIDVMTAVTTNFTLR